MSRVGSADSGMWLGSGQEGAVVGLAFVHSGEISKHHKRSSRGRETNRGVHRPG